MKIKVLVLSLLTLFSFSIAHADGDDIATARPNAVSIELLGRGVLYSINYDRSMSDSVGIGAGLATYSLSGTTNYSSVSATLIVIPIYLNYYFLSGRNRPFITGGVDVALASATVEDGSNFTGSGAAPLLGAGYEFRGRGGFLFRAAGYFAFINEANRGWRGHFWPGFSFGFAW